MHLVREAGSPAREEVEVLARVHREQEVDRAGLLRGRRGGRRRDHGVDLVPERAGRVLEDDADLGDVGDVRVRGEQLVAAQLEVLVRLLGMDLREPEPLQRVHDGVVLGAHDVAVARLPGDVGERRDVEVIEVPVRDHEQVDRRDLVEVDRAPGTGHDGGVLERILEHRIHQASRSLHLDEDRCVAEQRDLHLARAYTRPRAKPDPAAWRGPTASRMMR